MSFEKFNSDSTDKFDKIDSGPEAALMPRERERKLSEEMKESQERLMYLMKELSYLTDRDYFNLRQDLEVVMSEIDTVKADQDEISNKLAEILKAKENISADSLQDELNNNDALKN